MSEASKVAVVTGATSGIGRETALGLAGRGYTTVVVGRGEERVARTTSEIRQTSGNGEVTGIPVVDLALQSDVRKLAATLRDRFPRIHVLVNNAGALFTHREVTSEGLERTFALNVLAPFTLTSLLVDLLAAASPSRVVNISSAAHEGRQVPWEDLQSVARFRSMVAYGDSKLELLLLSREFARRLAPFGISVNAVHPGFVATHFGQNNGGGTAAVIRVLEALFGRRPTKGAETPIFVATSPELAGRTGGYYFDGVECPGSPESRDKDSARRIYEVCAELAGVHPLAEPLPGPATGGGAAARTAGPVGAASAP